MSPGAEVPYDVEVVVGHNIARVGCSRSVVGPCVACSLRSHVAPAPEILCFARLSIVMKQEPPWQQTTPACYLSSFLSMAPTPRCDSSHNTHEDTKHRELLTSSCYHQKLTLWKCLMCAGT